MKCLGRVAAVLALLVAVSVEVAEAHTFGLYHASFAEGLLHPLTGLDHVLAMVAIGLWAAQLAGTAIWKVPMAFVLMMILGGVLGMAGPAAHLAEAGILVSVVVLGGAVALAKRLPLRWCIALVGTFAIFHGHAHGTEMPAAASPLLYAFGFTFGTAILHAVGVSLGVLLSRTRDVFGLVRIGGGAIAAYGVFLLMG